MKDYVQLGPTGLAIRIFRSKKATATFQVSNPDAVIQQMEHAAAVDQIRRQVFQRDEWTCVHCSDVLTWKTAEMHERQARGNCQQTGEHEYQSGEQSVENGETRCKNCHTGKGGIQDRSPSFSSVNPTMTAASQDSLINRSLRILEGPDEEMSARSL